MDAHSTTKLMTYVMPDGTTRTVTSTKDYKFVVATADPEWRIVAKCFTKKSAEYHLDHFRKLWEENCPLVIIKRDKKEYIYREE